MEDVEQRRCRRCGREQPSQETEPSGLCSTCRGFDHAACNTFGLLNDAVMAVEGGWRVARVFDGGFAGWLCPHVHATATEADECPQRESLLR